ncbi:MAG: chemotaxis protein CheD [Smithella sp.]
MIKTLKNDTEYITLKPGEYFVSNKSVEISTLLGSCISVCLYDPANCVVGMNHFMLSNYRYSKSMPMCITEAGRYGVHAMELVINGMLKIGADRTKFRAKAFGGSSLLQKTGKTDSFFCVGEANVRFILEFLKKDRIPLVASDLGGDRGRKIFFSSNTYDVYVRKIGKPKIPELIKEEKRFWQNSIIAHEQKKEEPEIWR